MPMPVTNDRKQPTAKPAKSKARTAASERYRYSVIMAYNPRHDLWRAICRRRRGWLVTNLWGDHDAHDPIAGRYDRFGNRRIGGRGECGRAESAERRRNA